MKDENKILLVLVGPPASGKTYFAEEAIQLGLADEMGSLESAYSWILAKSEINKLKS